MYPWLSRTISQVKRSGNEEKKSRLMRIHSGTAVPNNIIKHPAFQPGPVIFSHEQDTGQRKKKKDNNNFKMPPVGTAIRMMRVV